MKMGSRIRTHNRCKIYQPRLRIRNRKIIYHDTYILLNGLMKDIGDANFGYTQTSNDIISNSYKVK